MIVVDDESTDATPEVAAEFGSRITYMRQANRRKAPRATPARRRRAGTYLAFLDSDDYWLPGKLAADLARFEQADRPALVYSRGRNVDRSRPAHRRTAIWPRRRATCSGTWRAKRSCP